MAKTGYVRVTKGWSTYTAYRDPDDNGWQIVLDGYDMWLADRAVTRAIEFLTELQKKASK